jgi:tyrosyl-DNA phosphodiesterase-1
MIVGLLQENSLIAKLKVGESIDVDSGGIEPVEPAMGWVYVGSHNFTQAAWGTLSGSAFNPVLNASITPVLRSSASWYLCNIFSQITNYELGIVLLLKDVEEADRVACFQRPPKKYTPSDEPWVSVHKYLRQDTAKHLISRCKKNRFITNKSKNRFASYQGHTSIYTLDTIRITLLIYTFRVECNYQS